jgi:AAA15 family ATPase/GTPase
MLCRFLFRNFRSYKDEAILDMQAAGIKEFSDTLLDDFLDKKAFLPVAVIYGPNGGGKSNVLKALSALASIVQAPICILDRKSGTVPDTYKNAPFTFDELSKKESTFFEVFFRVNEHEYRYAISLVESRIESESLYRKPISGRKISLVFDRSDSGTEFGAGLRKAFANLSLNPEMPLLSFLAITTDMDAIKEAAGWFKGFITVNYNIEESENFFYLNNDPVIKKLMISMLNEMDIAITDYYFKETDKKAYRIILKRAINGNEYEMPLTNESEGTKKLIAFLPQVISAINEGRVIIIDELDSKLHPKLLKHIIMLFKNPQINKKHAQLIFTSHDLATMRNDVFRRDEIWFAEKNRQGASMLYSLYDIRNEKNKHIDATAEFSAQYLEGRYGADPYLAKMKEWEN